MFNKSSFIDFIAALNKAQSASKQIKAATTPANDLSDSNGTNYYLSNTGNMGFCVSSTGELTSVYSLYKGMGDTILKYAVKAGAMHLDCFDGYLPTFYARHGFKEVRREANWTEGEPDVVYMERN